MTIEVTNADLYGALMGIKEDIGGLKNATDAHVRELESHAERIGSLEADSNKQKGAVRVWTVVAGVSGTVAGGIAAAVTSWMTKH